MEGLSRKYIRETKKIRYKDLGPDTILRAKKCITHQLACACAGREERWNEVMRSYVSDTGSNKDATIWFSDIQGNAFEATLANSTMAMSIVQEDIHREDGIHPGLIIIPCAFAIGEQYNLSGKAVLEGIVRGYQFLCKTGKGVLGPEFNKRGFRPTAVMGTFASAVTAGMLIGLTEDELVNACGIAGNFSCGVNEWACSGADEVYFHNGMSAAAGVIAAEAAKRGATGSEFVFEGTQGVCNAFGISREILESNIKNDAVLEIDKVVFKGAPCCNFNQAAATLALMAAADGIKPEIIEKGVIWTNTRATEYAGVDCSGPFYSTTQAKMSQQYTFAALLTYGKPVNDAFKDYSNDTITRLASVLELRARTEYDAIYPKRMQGAVELYLVNGEMKKYQIEEARYYDYTDIDEGFDYYLSKAFDTNRVARIKDMIDNIESLNSISELARLLAI